MKRIVTAIAAGLVAIGILQPVAPEAQAAAGVVTATMRGSVVTVTGTSGPDVLTVSNNCNDELECFADVTGRGVTFKPGPGCRRLTRGLICESPTPLTLVVRLGAGNDRLTTDEYFTRHQFRKLVVYGGPGDDTFLPRNPMDEAWYGGPGDDYLRVDTKAEGPERAGPDLFRGGAGEDTADYSHTPSAAVLGVSVSLDNKRNDGTGKAVDADDIGRDVEVVIGTDGPDELIGNKGPQHFEARAGADVIKPMRGADVVLGGRGDDSVLTNDGKPDQIDCGLGRDSLLADKAEGKDRQPQTQCEYITYGGGAKSAAEYAPAAPPARLNSGAWQAKVRQLPTAGTPSSATFDGTADTVTVVGNEGAQPFDLYVKCWAKGCRLEFSFEDDSLRPQVTPTVGGGCVEHGGLNVRCQTTSLTPTVSVDLGAGDDYFATTYQAMVEGAEVRLRVRGGEGNDFLQGVGGHETWDGGPGDDAIYPDYLGDRPEPDEEQVGATGVDDVRGGPGVDTVNYVRWADWMKDEPGVSVTLDDVANDASGIGTDVDNVHSDIENIIGSEGSDTLSFAGWRPSTGKDAKWVFPTIDGAGGDDVIIGSALSDRLLGDSGNDVIAAGAGNDWLMGGAHHDTLDGGAGRDVIAGGRTDKEKGTGNDRIVSRDDIGDRIFCGDGRDQVEADPSDTYVDPNNCERKSVKPHPGVSPQALPHMAKVFRVNDSADRALARVSSGAAKHRLVPVKLTIVSTGRQRQVLARGRMTLTRGFVGFTAVQLTDRARALLASSRQIEAQMILSNGWQTTTKPVVLQRG